MNAAILRRFALQLLVTTEGKDTIHLADLQTDEVCDDPCSHRQFFFSYAIQFLNPSCQVIQEVKEHWTEVPRQLRELLKTPKERTLVSKSSSKCDISPELRNDIKEWLSAESLPEDPAIHLYQSLCQLSEPKSPLETAKRQAYLVEFYHLREAFNKSFISKSNPLLHYIERKLDQEIIKKCREWAPAGQRLDRISKKLGGFGALLLPHNIARST
jgi:hypothetical protein